MFYHLSGSVCHTPIVSFVFYRIEIVSPAGPCVKAVYSWFQLGALDECLFCMLLTVTTCSTSFLEKMDPWNAVMCTWAYINDCCKWASSQHMVSYRHCLFLLPGRCGTITATHERVVDVSAIVDSGLIHARDTV